MASRLFVSLVHSLEDLRGDLIATGKEYDQYTAAEHRRALAFRVLASAHLEDYAERRCKEAAEAGMQRLQRAQPTRTGRSLLAWFVVNGDGTRGAIPLDAAEYIGDARMATALDSFAASVSKSHGVSGRKLRSMVVRLGVQDHDLDDQLFDALDALANSRNVASHARVNRAKGMTEPSQEWTAVAALLPLLEALDAALSAAVAS